MFWGLSHSLHRPRCGVRSGLGSGAALPGTARAVLPGTALPGIVLGILAGFQLVGCAEDEADPLPEGDRVSFRVLEYAGPNVGGGGEGGVPSAAEPPAPDFCFEPLVRENGLPECFVAEVADVLDCTDYGREPLRAEWEEPLRRHLCQEASLPFAADCDDVPVCGIIKLTGADAAGCAVGDPSPPGYCATEEIAVVCELTTADSLHVVTRVEAPLFTDAPKLVYAFCAVDPALGG